jgi:hypothetical protein
MESATKSDFDINSVVGVRWGTEYPSYSQSPQSWSGKPGSGLASWNRARPIMCPLAKIPHPTGRRLS